MNATDKIIADLRAHNTELQDELRRCRSALEALDPTPAPDAKPAPEQLKDGVLRIIQAHGPKTHHQLARALGQPLIRTMRAANLLVEGGALESEVHNKTTHYRVKRESIRLRAGEGEVA